MKYKNTNNTVEHVLMNKPLEQDRVHPKRRQGY